MTQAAIAAEIHQPLDVHGDLTTEVTLDLVALLEELADSDDLTLAELVGPDVRVNPRLRADLQRRGPPNAEDVLERDPDLLIAREVDTGNSCHRCNLLDLALALLVARVLADHTDDSLPPYDLALVAHLLYRCPNLHCDSSMPLDRHSLSQPLGSPTLL
jgi:hypothetical protein